MFKDFLVILSVLCIWFWLHLDFAKKNIPNRDAYTNMGAKLILLAVLGVPVLYFLFSLFL